MIVMRSLVFEKKKKKKKKEKKKTNKENDRHEDAGFPLHYENMPIQIY